MEQINPTQLYAIGKSISSDLSQLVTLFQLSQSPKYRHLAIEEQRFKLWAQNLGLYHQGHESLDYRVRDAEIVKSGFALILENIQSHLENLLAIERKERLPYEAQEISQDYREAEDDNSDTAESVKDYSYQASELSSASDDNSFHEVDFRLDELKEAVDALYNLADQSRSSLHRHQRNIDQLYKHLPAERRNAEIQEIEQAEITAVCYLHHQYLVEIIDKTVTADDVGKTLANYSSTEHWLLRRTGIANARRKQQFIYWKEHVILLNQMRAKSPDRTARQLDSKISHPIEPGINPRTNHRTTGFAEEIYQFLASLEAPADKADMTSNKMSDGFTQMIRRDYGDSNSSRSSIFDSQFSSSASSVFLGQQIPCEFHWYDNCEEMFDLSEINGWAHHIETYHLHMVLPRKSMCWFCDEIVFCAQPDTLEQRRLCYMDRMRHIAGHFRQGAAIDDVRPDFDFLHHLWVNNLISKRSFERGKNFHEAPQPKGGINSAPSASRLDRGAVVIEVASRPRRHSRGRSEFHTSYRAEQRQLPVPILPTSKKAATTLKSGDLMSAIPHQTRVLTVINSGGKTVEWPDPPKVDVIDGQFVCPYCKTSCPESYFQKSAWIVHLIHDLQPYHCTYEQCLNPNRIYGSRQEWIDHEGQHTRVWHCHEHSEEFETQQEYIQHLEDSHPDNTPEHFSSALVAAVVGPSTRIHRDCPFCPSGFSDIAHMQSHLIFHLEALAQLALPNNPRASDDDTKSGHSS